MIGLSDDYLFAGDLYLTLSRRSSIVFSMEDRRRIISGSLGGVSLVSMLTIVNGHLDNKVALICFAIAIPLLAFSFTAALMDEEEKLNMWSFAENIAVVGMLACGVGVAAMFWLASHIAGAAFFGTALIAIAVFAWLRERCERRRDGEEVRKTKRQQDVLREEVSKRIESLGP